MLEKACFHHLMVVTQDDPTKGPITERLESSKGGGIDILGMEKTERACLKEMASFHNDYEKFLRITKHQGQKELAKQRLRETNSVLPAEVQDSSHQ